MDEVNPTQTQKKVTKSKQRCIYCEVLKPGDFFDRSIRKIKPTILVLFCGDCRSRCGEEVLIYFYENKFNLNKFKEKFPDDQIEIISLKELEPKNEIKINLAKLVEKYIEEKQLHIENK